MSIDDVGREALGVTLGESLGELTSTPARDFLEDERGVMLLLRKALTGVTLSCVATGARGVVPLLVRRARELVLMVLPVVLWEVAVAVAVAVLGVAARRGVKGVFAVRLLASEGFSGGRGWFWLGRSMGILSCGEGSCG